MRPVGREAPSPEECCHREKLNNSSKYRQRTKNSDVVWHWEGIACATEYQSCIFLPRYRTLKAVIRYYDGLGQMAGPDLTVPKCYIAVRRGHVGTARWGHVDGDTTMHRLRSPLRTFWPSERLITSVSVMGPKKMWLPRRDAQQ